MRENLVGMRFGRLKVISFSRTGKRRKSRWLCRCECGNEIEVEGYSLKSGNTKSCGCLRNEKTRKRRLKHGKSKTSIYRIWASMIGRCERKTDQKYPDYGARGICVCKRWHDFELFYADVSQLANFGNAGYSLDRIDNEGNYELGNIRWATAKQQGRNKRNNHRIEINGEQMTIAQAVEQYQVNEVTILSRIKAGYTNLDLIRAANTAPKEKNKKCKYFVEYNGRKITVSEAANIAGISYNSMLDRVKRGYCGEQLLKPSWYEKKYGRKK